MRTINQIEYNSWIYMQAKLKEMNGGYLNEEELDQLEIGDVIQNLVENVPVKQGGPFNQKISASNGYSVWEGDYLGRYAIQVTRSQDYFYLSVGVVYNGSIYRNRNKTGYYLVGTNGTIEDVEEAIRSSSNYW